MQTQPYNQQSYGYPSDGYNQQFSQIAYYEEDENYIQSVNRINDKFQQIKDEIINLPKPGQHISAEKLMEQFKCQRLPLARIKKIMKSDEEVRVSIKILISIR